MPRKQSSEVRTVQQMLDNQERVGSLAVVMEL